ncbi:MAG: DUF2087 domain-containing protein [Myxococcales bacterium]|nr:DUF2087 domain-containing protein [Myxococcales bacterium]
MSRESIALSVPDLSAFARALSASLHARADAGPPGHVETLNLIARALGHRNLQSLQAALKRPPSAPPPPAPLTAGAQKVLGRLDADGRLAAWPGRLAQQRLAAWLVATRFAARRAYTEREVNAVIQGAIAFEDHVTVRRELVNMGLLGRTDDGRTYRKGPARPDEEARGLLHALRHRAR